MYLLLGLALFSLIVIVLLILFNVRAAANQRQKREAVVERPPVAENENVLKPKDDQVKTTKNKDPQYKVDDNYRQALRKFQDNQTVAEPEIKLNIPDMDYREALRALNKQDGDDGKTSKSSRRGRDK